MTEGVWCGRMGHQGASDKGKELRFERGEALWEREKEKQRPLEGERVVRGMTKQQLGCCMHLSVSVNFEFIARKSMNKSCAFMKNGSFFVK